MTEIPSAGPERITISGRVETEIVERKSRFIANAAAVRDEAEALTFIKEIKTKYKDATHNVFAYYIDFGTYARYSDDGEPQGTAGPPVLNVLQKSPFTDICVVVTRYFGGILLGAGGLVRAYSGAAKAALDSASPVIFKPYQILKAVVSYSEYQKLINSLWAIGVTLENSEFGTDVTVTVSSPETASGSFRSFIRDMTSGKSDVELLSVEERPEHYQIK